MTEHEHSRDEEIYAAYAGLVRKGVLQMMPTAKWGDIPE